jgi:enoyl-CoA hydratase
MDDDLVEIERDSDISLLTLNRPHARNALNVALAAAVCQAVEDSQDAAVIVITGADPAFCAGLDLRNLGADKLTELPPFLHTISSSQVPLIAAVNGPAVTGGLEIALACDFIIASDRAAFADTHLRVGVYPGPVAVDLPRRVGMAWARQMSLTGNFVDAQTALRVGLANEVVPHDQLLGRAMELARAIAEQDRAMVRALRKDWDESMGVPIDEGRRIHMQHAKEAAFTSSDAEGIAAKREAVIERARAQRNLD